MAVRLFRVAKIFEITSDFVIVSTDCQMSALSKAIRIGDQIEFHRADGTVIRSKIYGIPIGGAINPDRFFDFSLRDIAPGDIEVGAEIWLVE